jgi:hypothetical protein
MAYWNGTKIIYAEPKPVEDYPGWVEEDCGCCGGIRWGGEYPSECRTCCGSGVIFRHIKSGILAHYPGGPFIGSVSVAIK